MKPTGRHPGPFRLHGAMFAGLLAALLCADADAQTPAPREPTPFGPHHGVASPYRLSAAARRGTIRYRVVLPGASWYWPETGEQHVAPDGEATWLQVCSDCGREAAPGAAELERMRRPTPWLQSDDRALRGFARRAHSGTLDARMDRLVTAVRERLDGPVVYDRYLDARAAFDARRGDCTEYALLLAALARAEGIPTRVVAGIAYGSRFVGRPHAFGPHMWVQAWDGARWRSYDAGLAGFDAGHIALTVGDGSPESLRGTLQAIAALRILDAEGLRPAR